MDIPHQPPTIQKVTAILWPSFLVAGIATIATFAYFDPAVIIESLGKPPLSRLGSYSLGFFLFWFWTALSSAFSVYLVRCRIPERITPANGDEEVREL